MVDIVTPEIPKSEPHAAQTSPFSHRIGLALIIGLATGIFLIRFTGPTTWADGYHQERAVAYVMDVLFNGRWACQTGIYEDITSKPPLLTWLISLTSLALGGPTDFSLMAPSALATVGIALLIYWAGRKYFDPRAGLLGALMFLLSSAGSKQMVLIRIDVLFSFTIAMTALCAFACWQSRRGWMWFWLAAALATLAKGPLGLLLGGLGLLAIVWEKRGGRPVALGGNHTWGILLFFGLCGGWFAAAYVQMGKPLIDVMLGRELLGHVVQDQGKAPFSQFYSPILYVCRAFVPWVVLSFIGFWRIVKHPAMQDQERQFERFVFAWFTGGLFIFSAAAHQRPDLIFPLVPPAALLAGRELSRLWGSRPVRQMLLLGGSVVVVGLALMIGKYHFQDRSSKTVLRHKAIRELAHRIRALGGGEFPVSYIEGPVALQFYLGTKRPFISVHEGAELLRSPAAAFVMVEDPQALKRELASNAPPTFELASWDAKKDGFVLLSNRPHLQWTDHMVCIIEPLRLELQKVGSVRVRRGEFELSASGEKGTVILSPTGTNTWPRVALREGDSSVDLNTARRSTDKLEIAIPQSVRFRLLEPASGGF